MTEQNTPGAAFQRPPYMAEHFKTSAQAFDQATTEQPPVQREQESQPAPAPMTVTVPPARPRTSAILPQPRAAAPEQPSVAAPSTSAQAQEQSVPSAPVPSPDMAQWQKQLEAERNAYAQREQQWGQAYAAQQQELEELRKSQQELDRYRQRAALAQQLDDEKLYEGFETVDANDAKRIVQTTVAAMSDRLAQERTALAQEREQLQQQMRQTQAYAQQQAMASQAARIRDQLLAAHPDFFQLYDNDPAFQQFLRSREGKSSYTREQMAMAEYNAGNAEYLIDLLNRYKGNQPKPAEMQTVAPVQVANAAPVAPQAAQPQYTLQDLNYLFHTGRLTQDQYRDELNRLRAMQQQPA